MMPPPCYLHLLKLFNDFCKEKRKWNTVGKQKMMRNWGERGPRKQNQDLLFWVGPLVHVHFISPANNIHFLFLENVCVRRVTYRNQNKLEELTNNWPICSCCHALHKRVKDSIQCQCVWKRCAIKTETCGERDVCKYIHLNSSLFSSACQTTSFSPDENFL